MLNHKSKIYLAIAVIFMAVILLVFGLLNMFKTNSGSDQAPEEVIQIDDNQPRHPLSGHILTEEDGDFFPIAIMIDNAYDIRPQHGLAKADIIYEALAEGNITRLMAIFDSRQDIDKIGPVRSARNYYMDWAEEYGGVYIHVGGSPQALGIINTYDFVNIDQIGAGEIYFWRDENLWAPHNVFTSDSNWLRVGEIKEVDNIDSNVSWNFVAVDDNAQYPLPLNFNLDFSAAYRVDWRFNAKLLAYQRWQTDDKFLYDNGEQARADNIIVQIVSARIVDAKERRTMDNKTDGQAFIFNKLGMVEGQWRYENNRTRFFDSEGNEFKLVPGKTWVEVLPDLEDLIIYENDPA
jgi:hypothetical protein